MAKEKDTVLREEWPRIRKVTIRGDDFYQVDGRTQGRGRKTFLSLGEARDQADKWAAARERFGKAGRFLAERDAAKYVEAIEVLRPHNASITDAARFYVKQLEAEARKRSGKTLAEVIAHWQADYEKKDVRRATLSEIKSMARIFTAAPFGNLKLSALTPGRLKEWIESYQSPPGTLASPQTRANLRTKLSQLCNFAKLHHGLDKNPVDEVKLTRVPRPPVAVLDVKQSERLLRLADASADRATVLPYVAICLLAGLRPSEAERLTWRDIHFPTGEIEVRSETSKVKEDRFVPMEASLLAWLETCPHRASGPIIGMSHQKFRVAWEDVRRLAGYRIGPKPDDGWPASAEDWPADVLRHTFGSMWLAVHNSRAQLAERMGNSEAIIKQHYRRAIRQEVAKEFWAILPNARGEKKIIRMSEGVA